MIVSEICSPSRRTADLGSSDEAMIQHVLEQDFEQHNSVLEIGPGEGQFLENLARLFKHIVALDNSEAMLTIARKQLAMANIDFVLGDTTTECLTPLSFNAVVMNMVLHHNASPIELIKDSHRLLKPGGSLFISELCSHQQDWVREACGDLWLGFQPEDLMHQASQAGFVEGSSYYLAQRNGFVVQLRQFIKPAS